MNKSILLSIKPEFVSKILNGEKTIEVRKKFPKDFKGWVYIYCTKAKPTIEWYWEKGKKEIYELCYGKRNYNYCLNGKVLARFWCDNVEEISCCCVPYRNTNNLGYEHFLDNGIYKVEWKENINLKSDESKHNNPEIYKDDGVVFERNDKYIDTMLKNDDLKKMCLTPQQLLDYIALGNEGYSIHISRIEIFDKPKELSELLPNKIEVHKFLHGSFVIEEELSIPRKAPQNYCYVECEEM